VTSTAERLAARAEDLPEGSVRRRILEGARRFKAAWVEFGRLLSEVKREALWREWGYPSFERYCAKELFLRPATAEKLTAGYGFLERYEPELARGKGGAPQAPPFEVIEVLSRAEASGRLSDARWRELRDEVLDRPPTAAAVNKLLAERLGPPPAPPAPRKTERLERLSALARRLAAACREDGAVPRAVAQRAGELADELDALAGRDG
jgi:hypothetical protein